MKFRDRITVEREQGVWLNDGKRKKRVEEEDICIVELICEGVESDSEILKRVSDESGEGEMRSGLRLAQFVEDYGYFLKEGERPRVFGK